MPLNLRNSTILAKIEGTYGTDAVPTGGANAILVRNLQVTPQNTELVPRDVIRPYLGNSENLPASIHGQMTFQVEIAGSGAAGTAPPWAPLLRACGFSELVLAAAHSGTAQAGAASTITLAAGASATDNAYRGMTIRTTGGTGSGQSRVIASYVGATKVATVTEAFSPNPDATTTYTIDAQSAYMPISDTFPSLSMYYFIDGVRHRFLGARGTVNFDITRGQIPVMNFRFLGTYQAVTDTANPAVTLTGWKTPQPANNVNTTGVRLHGFTGAVISSMQFDMACNVVFRSLIGGTEQVLLTDRRPAGSITVEATTVASKDWWTIAKDATTGAFSALHGTTAGNKVKIDAPAVQLTTPEYEDLDGIAMLRMGLFPVPGANGNDEISISVQ